MQAQFSQNIHDFSHEIRCTLKLMAQHGQWKSSVMWCLSFQDHLWNKHTTTKNAGTEDPRFYRQQRRAAQHAKRGLAHVRCKMPVLTNHSRFLPRNLVYTKTDGTAWSMKVSFSHVVFIIPRPSLKRTHDHKERWNIKPAILQTTKKGCTTREALTQSRWVQACRGQRVARRLAAT